MRLNSALSTPSAASGSTNRRMLANQDSRDTGGGMRALHATYQPLVGVSRVLRAATSPPTHPTAIPPSTSTTPQEAQHIHTQHLSHAFAVHGLTQDEPDRKHG